MCFDNLNEFDKNNLGKHIIEEIHHRKIVLSDALEAHFKTYFETNRPELLDTYQNFIDNLLIYDDSVEILNPNNNS